MLVMEVYLAARAAFCCSYMRRLLLLLELFLFEEEELEYPRRDINFNRPNDLPVCKNTQENKEMVETLRKAIMGYLVKEMGMKKEDGHILCPVVAGMEKHTDCPSAEDDKLLFLHLINSNGDQEQSSFQHSPLPQTTGREMV